MTYRFLQSGEILNDISSASKAIFIRLVTLRWKVSLRHITAIFVRGGVLL